MLSFLQYACDLKAEVIGKPSPMFFQSALADMGLQPHEVCNNKRNCICLSTVLWLGYICCEEMKIDLQ